MEDASEMTQADGTSELKNRSSAKQIKRSSTKTHMSNIQASRAEGSGHMP